MTFQWPFYFKFWVFIYFMVTFQCNSCVSCSNSNPWPMTFRWLFAENETRFKRSSTCRTFSKNTLEMTFWWLFGDFLMTFWWLFCFLFCILIYFVVTFQCNSWILLFKFKPMSDDFLMTFLMTFLFVSFAIVATIVNMVVIGKWLFDDKMMTFQWPF